MADPNDIPLVPIHVVAERSHLLIPSLPNWIEPTVEYLRQKALLCGVCQETRSGKLLIALHEAITNAVMHGNLEVSSELKEQGDNCYAQAVAERVADPRFASRKVDIVVEFDGSVCQWIITDEGKGFDVERTLARCLSDDPEILLSSGRGVLMMTSFLDDVRYELGGRRVILSLNRLSGEERRTDTRVPLHLAFQVTPIATDGTVNWAATYRAVSRNFSENGIGLLQQQLAHSHRILIGIPNNQEIIYVPAQVKHARSLGNDSMELGCHFELPAEQDARSPVASAPVSQETEAVHHAITGVLDTHQSKQQATQERRADPRAPFNEQVVIHADHRTEPLIGYGRDLSRGGIALITREPVFKEITISFAPKQDQPPLKVRCRVLRCIRIMDGFYDVGAAFLRLDENRDLPEPNE